MKPWLTAAVVLGLCGFAWATLGLLKERKPALRAAKKTEAVQVTAAATGPRLKLEPEPEPESRGIGFGLTFARVDAAQPGADTITLSCHAEPKPLDRPQSGTCNPQQGDTSCRTVLPVLCFRPAGSGELMATEPVMGAVLQSEAVASARCEAEFGAGWRMAEFHDAAGSQLQGRRGAGFGAQTRYWVHVNDQPGNCWDSAP